jgi:predicted nucleotidyltransferase
MVGFRTLEQRRREKLEAMRRGIDQLVPRLTDLAVRSGGRFIMFGSAVEGTLHDQSDIDLIADFPWDRVISACTQADALCSELGLVGDVRPMAWASETLIQRARATGRVLG